MSDTVFEAWPVERPSMSLGRRVAAHAGRAAVSIAMLAATVGLITITIRHLPAASSPPPSEPFAPWREIIKPVQIFNLDAPTLAGAPFTYSARRHMLGGGREDMLAWGTLDGTKPAMRLRVFRRAEEAPSRVPLFAALAHEAAQTGLAIGRSGLPDLVATRFGRFELADVSLSQKDGIEAPCGGFRLILDKPALSVVGLVCGRRTAPLSHIQIGCLVERLDVAAARDDRELIDFFAGSELRRNAACTGMRLGPDGLHAPWLDEKPGPAVASSAGAPGPDKAVTSRKRLRRR